MWARMGRSVCCSRGLWANRKNVIFSSRSGVPSTDCCADLLSDAANLPYRLKMDYVAREYIEKTRISARASAGRRTATVPTTSISPAIWPNCPADVTRRNAIWSRSSWHCIRNGRPCRWTCDAAPCREVLLAIAHGDGVVTDGPSLQAELQALDFVMAHFEALEQSGLLIRVDGQPVAFSIYRAVRTTTRPWCISRRPCARSKGSTRSSTAKRRA